MAPPRKFEFVIVKLNYLSHLPPEDPRILLHRGKRSPTISMNRVQDWFDRVIYEERSKIDPNMSVLYTEWNIASGNANIFTVNGHRYEKVYLVLGEEVTHWVFYYNFPFHQRLEGFGRLPVKYCSCCLHQNYVNMMNVVKCSIAEKDAKENNGDEQN